MCIASLAYRLNRRKSKLQMVLSFYARARHTSKAMISLLHQAGIIMSASWTERAVKTISDQKHAEAIAVAATRPILLMHDNIRLKFPVQSQRGDNQGVSDNGTGITMLALPESAWAFEDVDNFGPFMRRLRAQRIAGTTPSLSWLDISEFDRLKRVREGDIFDIIEFLRMIPALKSSKALKSDKLLPKPGPQQLPHGKAHHTEMYMLPTVNIEEMTYSGNSQIIPFVLRYLELDSGDKRDQLTLERKVVWLGNQTSSQHCNSLQLFSNEARNPYDRKEPFIFIFGGFHCEIALGAGVFETS
jgi:hypothetical protein